MTKKLFHILFLFLTAATLNAQVKTNIDVINALIEKSAEEAANNLPVNTNQLSLNFHAPKIYEVFESRIISALHNNNINANLDGLSSSAILKYTLVEAKINYTDSFRDGLLGEYLVEREASLTGNYLFGSDGKYSSLQEFHLTQVDTIKYEDISLAESRAFPFTMGEKPGEPFFSSLLEPAIAVGAAVVTIYLFFTVRSN